MKLALGISAAAMLLAPSALAGVTTTFSRGPGLGLQIPDDTYNGTLGSMAVDRLLIQQEGIIKDINVQIGMSHTWAGDLTIKLVGPGGQVVTLVSRPGFAEPADDGTGCCGTSNDLIFANRITYDDESTGGPSENMGNFGNPIPAMSFQPSHGAAAPGNLSTYDGLNMAGLWELRIGDSAGGDLGVLDYWHLEITWNEIPAPGALALLGAAGLVARRRRRA